MCVICGGSLRREASPDSATGASVTVAGVLNASNVFSTADLTRFTSAGDCWIQHPGTEIGAHMRRVVSQPMYYSRDNSS